MLEQRVCVPPLGLMRGKFGPELIDFRISVLRLAQPIVCERRSKHVRRLQFRVFGQAQADIVIPKQRIGVLAKPTLVSKLECESVLLRKGADELAECVDIRLELGRQLEQNRTEAAGGSERLQRL